MITGYYDNQGYSIWKDDELLYEAGNNPLESSSVVKNGLPIETIREYCIQTGNEIAEEQNDIFNL